MGKTLPPFSQLIEQERRRRWANDQKETHEVYQGAHTWLGEQITEAERQGLTLDYVGGWHRFKPDTKALEQAWRVLYGIPESMTHLLTCPQQQWEQVILRWLGHRHEREWAWFRHVLAKAA